MKTATVRKPQISQETLRDYLRIKGDLRVLKEDFEAIQNDIVAGLEAGEEVEAGAYEARLSSFEKRSVNWKQVVVNLKGAGYANNVLSHTKAKTYRKLVVS